MAQVIEINQKRFFTIEEAKELLPIIRRITKQAFEDVKKLTAQLAFAKEKDQRTLVEKRVEDVFRTWHLKINKLGCDAKGMWLVDFDTGEGYYCWQYPEANIEYFHGYFEGFRGRVRIH